ncbi:MAG: hypothetical protein GX892_01155 [Thermoanaerobacteraceae bacterium]|nr:hypothetical protein [Thermoanaerobacteraceae bacterium]
MTTEERLNKLEKTVRLLVIILAICIGGWLATGLLYFQGTIGKNMQTETLAIVDKEGSPRLILGVLEDEPYLNMLDEEGEPYLTLGLFWSKPFLGMYDEEGRPRLALGVVEDRTVFHMYDKEGNIIFSAP